MTQTPEPPDEFDELAGLVKASFPNIKCLRCGHEEFFMTDDVDVFAEKATEGDFASTQALRHRGLTPVIALACTRCGHIEQHLVAPLRRSQKPILAE
jgi:Zn ribbon nucleic-acid-binding protein